jgi:hypothetical protein
MANIITLGLLIDKTVEHYHKHFKELVGITLWLIVGASPFLFSGYIAPAGVDSTTPMNEIIVYLGINVLGLITTTLSSLWIAACLMLTINARAKGNTPNHEALGKQAWKFTPGLFVFGVLFAIVMVLGATVLFIPGIIALMANQADGAAGAALGIGGVLLLFAGAIASLYFVIRYSVELAFAQYAIVLEQPTKFSLKNMWSAVQSSRASVRGAWWAVAIRLLVPNAIISLIVISVTMGVNFAMTIIFTFAAASLSALAIKFIAILLTMSIFIVNALVMPLYSLATYYLYDSVKRT